MSNTRRIRPIRYKRKVARPKGRSKNPVTILADWLEDLFDDWTH